MSVVSKSVLLCLIASLALTSACGSGAGRTAAPSSSQSSGVRAADGVRTDLSPLYARFPELEGLERAWWVSGDLGDGRVPGPASYWIDAVVELPENRVEKWVLDLDLNLAVTEPDVDAKVRAHVPDEELLAGQALDERLSHEGWSVTAHLAVHGSKVVLRARGQ